MRDDLYQRLFAALVKRAGGGEVVAAIQEARYGKGAKSTVSRMIHGSIGVTIEAVIAIEDDLRVYPITEALAARINVVASSRSEPSIADLAARSVLAAGEAHAALIRAFAEHGDGGVDVTVAEAAAIADQMGALRDLADQIVVAARRMVRGVP